MISRDPRMDDEALKPLGSDISRAGPPDEKNGRKFSSEWMGPANGSGHSLKRRNTTSHVAHVSRPSGDRCGTKKTPQSARVALPST